MSLQPPATAQLDYVSADTDQRRGMIRILAVLSIICGSTLGAMHVIEIRWYLLAPEPESFLALRRLRDISKLDAAMHALGLLAGILLLAGGIRAVGGRARAPLAIGAALVLFEVTSLVMYWLDWVPRWTSWERLQWMAYHGAGLLQDCMFPLTIVLLAGKRNEIASGQDGGRRMIRTLAVLSIVFGAAMVSKTR